MDNNIVFNDPITKNLMINILYNFVEYYDIAHSAGKTSSDFELASFGDFIDELNGYNFDFSGAIDSWQFDGNSTLHLNEFLKFLKHCAEFYDLK